MSPIKRSAIETARQHWSDPMPDWIQVLADNVDKTSQVKVARVIGYTSPVISLILKKKYAGTISNIEKKVRIALMDSDIRCPVLGRLLERDCLKFQATKFSSSADPERIRMYRACCRCKFKKQGGK